MTDLAHLISSALIVPVRTIEEITHKAFSASKSSCIHSSNAEVINAILSSQLMGKVYHTMNTVQLT